MAPLPDVELRKAYRTFLKKAGPDRGREYVALQDVTFSISSGEFFCLLGPSGCGKSTVLRMIAGFLTPSAGEVLVRGKRVDTPGRDRAVVFQGDSALFNWLTTYENVEFGLRMRNAASLRKVFVWSDLRASSIIIPISSPAACVNGCRLRAFSPTIRQSY